MADMRLIDANAVEKEFESCLNFLCENPITRNTYEMSLSKHVCDAVLRVLRNAQTIDPESLRPTGHWEESEYDGYLCSECGWGDAEGDPSMDYCPNCGAKMR